MAWRVLGAKEGLQRSARPDREAAVGRRRVSLGTSLGVELGLCCQCYHRTELDQLRCHPRWCQGWAGLADWERTSEPSGEGLSTLKIGISMVGNRSSGLTRCRGSHAMSAGCSTF